MSFHVGVGSCYSDTVGVLNAAAGDVEAWLQVKPGSPDVYIGGNSGMDSENAIILKDGDPFLRIPFRYPDQLYFLGSEPTTPSYLVALIHVSQPTYER